ncbi:15-hydroxyprostaglandin dehydrogenase [NAD(+)]-like [Anopheles nili]|uniref:15-hydroxyprostaglandin dehydrogenase [NAD(+)]-like n=1 Tax=Anopheles nili TaxID=185578 RepID=UPI00237C4927|nr:15-hydroxyprostaglandin dehydrogenase [NAD(+)]-like [Anopheles nili]
MDLENKVAIVTGGATGLGRAFSEELLKHGAKVLICDLDYDAGELAMSELKKQYKGRVLFRHCDVTDCIQFEEAFEYALCMFLAINIVINNVEIMNDNFWELEVDVNLNGTIRGTLLAQKFMGKQRGGEGGVLVNIGSGVSIKPQVSTPIYTATKHAILGLTKAFGDPVNYENCLVRAFAYCPGPIENSFSEQKRFQLPGFDKAKECDLAGMQYQSMEHVAKELIPLLKNASPGSIWFVADGEPAKEIPYSNI